jgi:hypothetical protein
MLRKRKFLGVLIVAALAISALGVSAASASAAEFHAAESPVKITADQTKTNVFTVDGTKVECTTAHFVSGLIAAPSPTAEVHPEYSGCTAFGFVGATVNTESCNYVLHASGSVDIVCPTGQSIKITASTCAVEVGSQSGLTSIAYTNSGNNVIVTPNVSGITATKTKDGFLCPLNGTGTVTNGTYTGAVEAKGTNSSGQPDAISVS